MHGRYNDKKPLPIILPREDLQSVIKGCCLKSFKSFKSYNALFHTWTRFLCAMH